MNFILGRLIGRSVWSTTSSIIQIPTTTTPPIIPKQKSQNRESRYGTSYRPALFHAVLVIIIIKPFYSVDIMFKFAFILRIFLQVVLEFNEIL